LSKEHARGRSRGRLSLESEPAGSTGDFAQCSEIREAIGHTGHHRGSRLSELVERQRNPRRWPDTDILPGEFAEIAGSTRAGNGKHQLRRTYRSQRDHGTAGKGVDILGVRTIASNPINFYRGENTASVKYKASRRIENDGSNSR